MGVSRSPFEFATKLEKLVVEVGQANRAAINAAALIVTREIRTRTAAATGGDMRLSGVGKRGARVGVGYDVKGDRNATALIRARGPFHLVERDVKPHDIKLRRDTGKRRSGPRALRMKNLGFARSAKNAGGSKGRRPFERGTKAGEPKARLAFEREQAKALARVFGS